MDRVQQVNWIREVADDITCNVLDCGFTGEELVTYCLDEAEDIIELPEWFDSHDRGLLVRFADELLDNEEMT